MALSFPSQPCLELGSDRAVVRLKFMKILEYKTAVGSDALELDKEVNELIRNGFEPYGTQYFATWDLPGKVARGFFQAMVKKEA